MKQKISNQYFIAAVAVYVLVYACLTYILLSRSTYVRPGDIILAEVAVIANVAFGIVLAILQCNPRFQIVGSLVMIVTYAAFQVLLQGLTSLSQIPHLLFTSVALIMLPLLLPLVVGVVREVDVRK